MLSEIKLGFLLNDYYNYDIKNSIIETIDDNRYLYSVKLEKLIKNIETYCAKSCTFSRNRQRSI